MPENNQNKKNLKLERTKLIRKEFNRFLNSYFKLFVVLVVFTIFIFGFFTLIKPKYKETLKLVEIIGQQEELNVSEKQKELEQISNFLLDYSKIDKKYMEKANAIVPSAYNQEELFTEMNHIVSKSGLIMQFMSVESGGEHVIGKSEEAEEAEEAEKSSSGVLKKMIIKLNVKGTDYKAFKNFLLVLENNIKLMDIINVGFDPGGEATNVIINTYYIN